MSLFKYLSQSRHKAVVLFVCVSLLLTGLVGCAGESPVSNNDENGEKVRTTETIRVAVSSYPPSMDPYNGWELAGNVCSHVTEQLLTHDEDWNIIPQLAEKYESNEDYSEWTFKLREGIYFHNGKEVTAEDVKASIERWQMTSSRAQDLEHLSEIQILDEYTVNLVLDRPDPLVPVSVAFPSAGIHILPKEVLEEVEGFDIPPEQIIGTGPYYIAESFPDRHIKFVRFEDYKPDERYEDRSGYGGYKLAYADEIMFIPVPDPSSRTAGILAGDYDFAEDLPKSDYDTLVNAGTVQVLVNPTKYFPDIYFRNVEGAMFGDVNMRRAVQAALNMDEIMLAAAEREEFYRLDSSVFSEESIWHYPAGQAAGLYNAADADLAKSYLDKAGYNGEEIVIIACSDYDWIYREGIVIAEQLKAVGMNVKLEIYDWATALSVRNESDKWDLFCSGDNIMNNDGSYLNFWHSDQNWVLSYPNPTVDALIEEGMKYPEYEQRYPIYCDLQEALCEDASWIIMGHLGTLSAASENLKGFKNYAALRFYNVWIEK